jgi:site-specific recombinase XerD
VYRTGLRISEALALRVKDIDTEVGSVTVLHGKGDWRRTVGIDPGANESIEPKDGLAATFRDQLWFRAAHSLRGDR